MGFVAGLLIGAAAGLVAGLLAAPKSGQQNREFLEEQLPEVAARAPEVVATIRTEATKRVEEGKEAFLQGVSESRQRLTRQLERAQRGEPSQAPE